jgi:hypothetical protein
VKKTVPLFFMSLLIVVQYAKHVSYLGCQFLNSVSSKEFKCDCQAILTNTSKPTNDFENTVQHNHIHIDDYCQQESTYATKIIFVGITITKHKLPQVLYSFNFNNKLLKPPQV